MKKYWDMVNKCESHEDIRRVERIITDAECIDIDTYDDMMNALAYISRELYREKR